MALCTFTYRALGGGYGYNTGVNGYQVTPGGTHQNGIATLVYGTNASNARSYGATITQGTKITTWTPLVASINTELTRRGAATVAPILINSIIHHLDYNVIRTALLGIPAGPAASQAYMTGNVGLNRPNAGPDDTASIPAMIVTYPQAAAPTFTTTTKNAGAIVYALDVNAIINDLNNAGAVCTCNCNYCTCNCNYCTCNCNYACTCNCNYAG